MAGVALKVKLFESPVLLAAYCANAANNVTTIVSITFNGVSGQYTLFYT
jgi:hypothetical protein